MANAGIVTGNQFTEELIVSTPDYFLGLVLLNGIGTAISFGCGLMLVSKVYNEGL